ncbi:uncharacterized protein LOC132630605 [Lycium barbarum]|uniref:uncharacterized protein LOC132630605 n=1 Tax=Lycium barbarum TaxID=112863 RepID=UPI00293F1ECE|nr:uncharacterized protein LOC132630605 [Lycium barbarum]
MVAEVSTLIRIMNRGGRSYMNESSSSSKSTALITRDLLGGCCTLDSKELDLDLQVPSGWEKRLDLKSGKVYLQRSNSSNYSSSTTLEHSNYQTVNAPATKLPLSLFEDTKLDLKPPSSSSPSSSAGNYHSVCTLEKVKSALERAEKQSTRKRSSISSSSFMSMSLSSVMCMSSSSPNSNSSISSINVDEDTNGSFAAGCPSCLLYVLISRTNPRCPRCNTIVPLLPHVSMKKPRIDLNISI